MHVKTLLIKESILLGKSRPVPLGQHETVYVLNGNDRDQHFVKVCSTESQIPGLLIAVSRLGRKFLIWGHSWLTKVK